MPVNSATIEYRKNGEKLLRHALIKIRVGPGTFIVRLVRGQPGGETWEEDTPRADEAEADRKILEWIEKWESEGYSVWEGSVKP